jgi:hypothetical protein
MGRECDILTEAIGQLLAAGGAGERPVQSSLTSPVFVLPDPSPLWRAFVCLVYTCSKKAPRALLAVPERVRVRLQCLHLRFGVVRIVWRGVRWCKTVTGHAAVGRIVGLDAVRVNQGSWP